MHITRVATKEPGLVPVDACKPRASRVRCITRGWDEKKKGREGGREERQPRLAFPGGRVDRGARVDYAIIL